MKLEENPQFIFGMMGLVAVVFVAMMVFVFALFAAAGYALFIAYHVVRDDGWPLALVLGAISAFIYLAGLDAVSRAPEDEKIFAVGIHLAVTALPFYAYLGIRTLVPMNQAKAMMLRGADSMKADMRITSAEHRKMVCDIRKLSNEEAEQAIIDSRKHAEAKKRMAHFIQPGGEPQSAFDVPEQH